jgi:hypothetical protein
VALFYRREFQIVSDMNGLVLDVKHNNANPGAEVIMWNKKSPPARNQLWYADQQGFIRSALNDFALDAGMGSRFCLFISPKRRPYGSLKCNKPPYQRIFLFCFCHKMQAESISQKRRETSHQFLSDVN